MTTFEGLLPSAHFMSADKRRGIADDASDYEDLPEADERPPPAMVAKPAAGPPPLRKSAPRGASGIASDADLFADMLEESSDAVRSLESEWLYQQHGQVFGPVKPKALLEMLYKGDVTPDTPVSSEEGDFRPIRHYAVFRAHLPKIEAHQRERAEAEAAHRAEVRARLKRRLGWASVALVVALVGSAGIAAWVRQSRLAAAEAEKQAKEAELKKELDDLLASVTIEPPLLQVVEDPAPDKRAHKRHRRRRKSRAVARFSGGAPKSGELTRSEIMAGVGRAFTGIKRCIVQQMQRDRESVAEQVVLTFSIDNEGRAQNVSLSDRFLRKSPLRACMATKLAKVKWRAYKGEVQNIEYPITIGRR